MFPRAHFMQIAISSKLWKGVVQPGTFEDRGSVSGKYVYTDGNASFNKHENLKPCRGN